MISLRGLSRQRAVCASSIHKQYFYTANGFRTRPKLAKVVPSAVRCNSTAETGEDETGHITTTRNEGIFFFDNIFPLKLQWLTRIPFLDSSTIVRVYQKANSPDIAFAEPSGIIQRALPKNMPVKLLEIIPRVREGGAYVKFEHDAAISDTELEGTLRDYLQEKPIRPWFNPFRRVRAFLVKGKPWIEDLYRLPSSRLKVEFLPPKPEATAAELTQETLYSLFRKYGPILEITPQPFDSKVIPRYALIDYTRTRFATMAKNCMHGFILVEEDGGGKSGTLLKTSYEPRMKTNWIKDWITNHPRIVFPVIAALLAAASVTVFDPIRTMFIRLHLTQGAQLEQNKYYQWIRKWLSRGYDIIRLSSRKSQADGMKAIWEDRHTQMEQLRSWMSDSADTFIVVQGPRGAGKKQLVDQALTHSEYKLVIDCKKIQDARGDSKTIQAAANEVGYWPVFSWMNSISSLIDLAAMGTIGTKTGFSETLENQLVKIYSNTSVALKKVALSHRKKTDQDAALGDDEWLEAHPEYRPIVVIDNFLHKSGEGPANMVYDKLAEWGATITTGHIAHVLFLTTDVSFSKALSKALPDRVFRQITLGDCSPEVAKRVVIKHIDADSRGADGEEKLTPSQLRTDLDELDSVIQVLGGRLTDLEFLARRIAAGESPGSAVRQIIDQSASEILKMYLLDTDRKWTPQQAWVIIKELAANEELRYNELLLNAMFGSQGEQTLQLMEQAELISILSANGRPNRIRPGKPVYLAAFQSLTEDEVLRSKMDLSILTTLAAAEAASIQKCEDELMKLADLPGTPAEVKPRIHYLLKKTAASQANIAKYEEQSGKLKKVLMEKF